MNVIDRNDISEIGAVVLSINMLGEVDENNKKIVVSSNIENKEIRLGRVVNGEYRESLIYSFVSYWNELEWLRGLYQGLIWSK